MDINLEASPVFQKIHNSKSKIVLCRGGARSTKTASIIIEILLKLIQEANIRIVVARKTLAILKDTFLFDVQEWIERLGIGHLIVYYKHTSTIWCWLSKSSIKFLGCDEPRKFRGLEANYWVFNEANEIPYEFFKQAIMRMSRKNINPGKQNRFYLDFNPSSRFSWVKTKVEDVREDVDIITSTYLDNPFLTPEAVKEIERLKETDPDAWKIYGLGDYTDVKGAIYKNFNIVDEFPENAKKIGYGMDFGFTIDPSSLIKVGELHGELYVEEIIYETDLTNQDISNKLIDEGIKKTDLIIADSDEPKSIEEIKREGWNIRGCKKGPDSIRYGISTVKQFKINVCRNSHNLLSELNLYKWKEDRNGDPTQTPVDKHNHALDALRYYVTYFYQHNSESKIIIY